MKRDDKFGCLAVLAVIAAAIILATIMNSCSCSRQSNAGMPYHKHYAMLQQQYTVERNCRMRDSLSLVAQQDTVRWAQFLECSKDQGDWGCDSCFIMIYGYSIESIVFGEE